MTDTTLADLILEPTSPEHRADPYSLYKRLRSEDPVHKRPDGAWLVSRYNDVVRVLRDPRMSADARNADRPGSFMEDGADAMLQVVMSQLLLFTDPPDHTRLRSLVQRAFTPRSIEAIREHIQEVVDDLLDAAAAKGEMDVIADLSYPLPVIVIAEMLGVPPEDRAMFKQWAGDLARTIDPLVTPDVMTRAVASGVQFIGYFGGLIEQRRADPKDDLLSALIAAEEEGDRLTQGELVSNCILLLIAGHETTMNLIGNGMLALLRNEAELVRLRKGPELIKSAVEEILRYDSPVQLTARAALDDTEVGGRGIRAREQIVVLLGAANRDPEVFADPDRLDLGRSDNRHVAFGFGPHFCLGAPLARVEAQIAISSLVRRFGQLELAIDQPVWRDTVTLRGLTSLPIRIRNGET